MRRFHITHNICLKFLLGITVVPQEKSKTMLMHFFVQVLWGGGGEEGGLVVA